MKVNIVSKELIKPSIPTPQENANYNLSFLDEPTPHFYIPLILYYENNQSQMKQYELMRRLESALTNTLNRFYPLAGRSKEQTVIHCNDEGVCFVEAQVEATLQEIIGSPDAKESENLIPCSVMAKTEELLAIQVSFFSCGGVSIGVCISHRISDVSTLSAFLKGWAASALVDQTNTQMVSPVFNGSSLFPARGTPDFKPQEDCSAFRLPLEPLVTKRFVFNASSINEMKAKHAKTNNTPTSRVELVSALLWKHCTAAKVVGKQNATSFNIFPVNLRRRIGLPLTEYSFGNFYQTVSAMMDGEEDWPCLVSKLRAASEKIDSSYVMKLAGQNGHQVLKDNFGEFVRLMAKGDMVFRFTSWCGFAFYELDFGWGRPAWVSTPGFGTIDTIILLDSRYFAGIEACVTMADQDMTRLQQDLELQAFTC